MLPAVHSLFVLADQGLQTEASTILRQDGHLVSHSTDIQHALQHIQHETIDVVLCDMQVDSSEELVQWLGSYYPSIPLIIIFEQLKSHLRTDYEGNGTIRLVEKPVTPLQLVQLIKDCGPRKGFYGNAIEIELFDYVQMIALTGRDKTILVRTKAGEGCIWFEHGDISHVQFGTYEGEDAFYKLLGVSQGTFHETLFQVPPKRTVMRSSTHLLMEAARLMDEGELTYPEASGEAEPPQVEPETIAEDEYAEFDSFDDIDLEVQPPPPPPPVPKESFAAKPQEAPQLKPSAPYRPPSKPSKQPQVQELTVRASPKSEKKSGALELLDDPETRALMLGQFWQFEGVEGVALISSTGKVIAEDMRGNSTAVTLAGFYMRGAARIARDMGYNVFDGVVAHSNDGQQLLMVSMGATSAVLAIAKGHDPEIVRNEILGGNDSP